MKRSLRQRLFDEMTRLPDTFGLNSIEKLTLEVGRSYDDTTRAMEQFHHTIADRSQAAMASLHVVGISHNDQFRRETSLAEQIITQQQGLRDVLKSISVVGRHANLWSRFNQIEFRGVGPVDVEIVKRAHETWTIGIESVAEANN